MLWVLHLQPILTWSGTIQAIATLRDYSLEIEIAGFPKQVRADLALLEVADEDAFRPARQQPGQVVLPKVQRQLAQVLAIQ